MNFNALTFDRDILSRKGADACGMIYYAGSDRIADARVKNFIRAGSEDFVTGDGIYLPSLFASDDETDAAIDGIFSGAEIILSACATLDEVGTCDKKYSMTPIGLAHKYGLLCDQTYIAGGVYLDKDDIDLIIQSGAKVILTPSDSMGNGCGIPPLRMLAGLGATVRLGTGTGKYNREADLAFESHLIYLAASGMLCTPSPVTDEFMKKLIAM